MAVVDLENVTLLIGEYEQASGPVTLWRYPEDAEEARARFGNLVEEIPVGTAIRWAGLFDAPFHWAADAGRNVGGLIIEGSEYAARAVPLSAARPPAVVGEMVVGQSIVGDERGSRTWAVTGRYNAELPAVLSPEVPAEDVTSGPISSTSEIIGRDDSRSIRLASIDVVERLTFTVEDAAESDTEIAMVRALREYLVVLREHVEGRAEPSLAARVMTDLRFHAKGLTGLTNYVGLADLGWRVLELLGDLSTSV
jgi:hypothetical protein